MNKHQIDEEQKKKEEQEEAEEKSIIWIKISKKGTLSSLSMPVLVSTYILK